jgi:hypothetical protein
MIITILKNTCTYIPTNLPLHVMQRWVERPMALLTPWANQRLSASDRSTTSNALFDKTISQVGTFILRIRNSFDNQFH